MADSASGFDRHITIFSPDGRLYQVEYAFKAVKAPGETSLGVKSPAGVVLVTQKKVPDALIVGSSITRLYSVTPAIGVLATGPIGDCRAQVTRLRHEAATFRQEQGYPMPAPLLAARIASVNQVFTQHAAMRVLGCTLMIASCDDEEGPCLYKVDPAGSYAGYFAAAAGEKELEANNLLEKKLKQLKPSGASGSGPTEDKTIQIAIGALQTVLGVDFRAKDIEVGVASAQKGKHFRMLSTSEIDEHLNIIAESDD